MAGPDINELTAKIEALGKQIAASKSELEAAEAGLIQAAGEEEKARLSKTIDLLHLILRGLLKEKGTLLVEKDTLLEMELIRIRRSEQGAPDNGRRMPATCSLRSRPRLSSECLAAV